MIDAYEPDEYVRQLVRQNTGLACEHCGFFSGHSSICPLICRESAEALSSDLSWRHKLAQAREEMMLEEARKASMYTDAFKTFEQLLTDGDQIHAKGMGIVL